MSKRLFIALEPPPSCRETLVGLDPGLKGVRWLRAEQMHLTLGFLGDVGSGEEERLRDALAGVCVPAFFLRIQGVGTFGGAHPTVVWAGVGKGHPHLFALNGFHPHITIARARGVSREVLLPFLRRHAEEELGLWKVSGFTLFSSVLSPKGATYSVEIRSEL